MDFAVIHTPIGYLRLVEEEKFLTEVSYISSAARAIPPKTSLLVQVAKQLEEYFNGCRYVFDLPIKFSGGAYKQKV